MQQIFLIDMQKDVLQTGRDGKDGKRPSEL